MVEKVNPKHPDKVADRIAGAIVDLAYKKEKEPKIAVEILIGHRECNVIIETDVDFEESEIYEIVERIDGKQKLNLLIVEQDKYLNQNQEEGIKAGDNGIFKGAPLTEEQIKMSKIAREIYGKYESDGKYILDGDKLIICQSNAEIDDLKAKYPNAVINPLGSWTGGTDVDTGATNRKLGSDMADSVTGGGFHGKDLSKGDVAINIYAFLKAQKEKRNVYISCAIGDTKIDGKDYSEIVKLAKEYIEKIGGFEKLAEWGLF